MRLGMSIAPAADVTPVLPPGVEPPIGEGGGTGVPTLIQRGIGSAADAELWEWAQKHKNDPGAPARMALTGREVTSLDPANRAIVDSQLDAASRAAQAKQGIESAVAPAQTYAAHQAVGAREANIGDYGLSAQQQQARQDELYARADALLRGMEGTHDATFGERLQDMGGSMSKAFGGTDVAQENAKRLDANKFEAVKLLAEQFGRAGTMGAVGRTDADKVQALRQAAVDAQLAFEQRKAENAPMEGGPPLYGTDRQAAQQQAEPQAPTVAKPAEHGAKPKGTPQQQLREFVKTLAAPTAPETKAQRTLRELMDRRGTRGNLNQSDAESPLSGGIADVMRETPADTAAPVAQAAPASPVAAAAAALERKYPGPYDQDPNPRVTRASVMHTETDMAKARADAATSIAALGRAGLGEKQKFALHGGSPGGAGVLDVLKFLSHGGSAARGQAIQQRAGDEANESREQVAISRARSRANGNLPPGEVAEKETVKVGSDDNATRIHIANPEDRKFAARIVPDIDAMVEGIQEIRDMSKTVVDRGLNENKIKAAQKYVRERATGVSTTFAHSNRAAEPVMANAAGAAGTLAAADVFRRPEALGADSDAVMADAIARMTRARDAAIAHIGGTPVVRTVDEYGAPHFTYVAPGSAPPSQPSAGAPAYTPGGAKPTGKISIGDPAAKGP